MNRHLNRWLIAFVTALSSLVVGGVAGAQQTEWVSGGITNMKGFNCVTNREEIMLSGYASYQRYTDQSAPKTGDSTYVSVVMSVPGQLCNPDSSVSVIPALVLPQGASLNITAQTPVRCFYKIANPNNPNPPQWTQFTGTQIGIPSPQNTGFRVGPICPDGQGGGYGTPFQIGPSGIYGGLALGIQYLPVSSDLEILVPIKFENELLGASGPNGGDKLKYIFDTVGLTPDPAIAEVLISVPYRAIINYPTPATNITASSAQLNAELYSYYKGGTAFFDYGTTTSYGSSVSQSVASTFLGANVFSDVTGLAPNTTYNYRLRYVTMSGTFLGANRTFVTSAAQNQTLSVTKTGAGTGTVSSSPAGINCGATCSASFPASSSVTLTATPASGSSFAGWGGACSGTGACAVTMSAARSVTASFTAAPPPQGFGSLSITLVGLPTGTLATLSLTRPDGSSVPYELMTGLGQNMSDVTPGVYTVTAPNITVANVAYTPNAVSQSATVTVGGNATINVTYSPAALPAFALSVTKAGTGTGDVSSNPAGISCGATCTANFASGSSVTLTAAPSSGSSFAGWGGACSGSGATCRVTMSAAQSVTATFNTTPIVNFALTVTKSGTGTGTVSSQPAGLDCGATCAANFASGSSVTLTAAPLSGSSFTGWGGACSGSASTCTVTMSSVQNVTASFATTPPAPLSFALTVTKSGTGVGSVSSNPGGIACGATCVANFGQASNVTLTATLTAGSSFAGWGGACSGSGACVVTMSSAQGVTATFTLNAPTPPPPPAPPTAPPASLGKPSGSPASANANKSENNVGALRLELGVGTSSPLTLQSLNFSSSGTGNDALDITGIKLYVDANGNGIVDAGETALAQGTFSGNDGAATLTLAAPRIFAVNSNTKLLVTLDFNSSLAQTSNKLALGSLALALLLGWRSKKRLAVIGLLAMAITINACRPEPVIPPTGSSTYAISLTGISLKDVNGAAITVSGLPIAGTTITVAK